MKKRIKGKSSDPSEESGGQIEEEHYSNNRGVDQVWQWKGPRVRTVKEEGLGGHLFTNTTNLKPTFTVCSKWELRP